VSLLDRFRDWVNPYWRLDAIRRACPHTSEKWAFPDDQEFTICSDCGETLWSDEADKA
jgi:hypothetical protein